MISTAPDPEPSPLEQLVSSKLGRPWRAAGPEQAVAADSAIVPGADGLDVLLSQGDDLASAARFHDQVLGLHLLAETGTVRTPRVFGILAGTDRLILVQEAVVLAEPTTAGWQDLGRRLAALHRHTHHLFGLEKDNFLSTLRQDNRTRQHWPDFFAHHRLAPLVRLAADHDRLGVNDVHRLDQVISRVPEWCGPAAPPALLHGNLWSGSILFDAGGAVLVDSAVYYGHREVEIATAELFGDLPAEFFEAYDEAFPLDLGYPQRRTLWQLYPLLALVNLHPGHYVAELMAAVETCLG